MNLARFSAGIIPIIDIRKIVVFLEVQHIIISQLQFHIPLQLPDALWFGVTWQASSQDFCWDVWSTQLLLGFRHGHVQPVQDTLRLAINMSFKRWTIIYDTGW